MKFHSPQCLCSFDLAQRIPEILQRCGYSVSRREPRKDMRGEKPAFQYAISDGVRRAHLIGLAHKERLLVFLPRVGSGWKLQGLFGREKFASAIIARLLEEGASKPPLPDEAKLHYLAERGNQGAKMMLRELSRKKGRTA